MASCDELHLCGDCERQLPADAFRKATLYRARQGRLDILRCKACNIARPHTSSGRPKPKPRAQRKVLTPVTPSSGLPLCTSSPKAIEVSPTKRKRDDSVQGSTAADAPQAKTSNLRQNWTPTPKDTIAQLKDTIAMQAKRKELNDTIALHARRKELKPALALFEEACREGLANGHTYGTTLNALVRCGDIPGATALYSRFRASGLPSSVVAASTYLKGLCSIADMASATALLQEMAANNIVNVRAINNYLRGCLANGNVPEALACIEKMKRQWGVTPDVSTLEYTVQLLSQSLNVDEARAAAKRLAMEEGAPPTSVAHARLCVARAALLRGDRARALQETAKAERALDAPHRTGEGAEGESGGKRGWGSNAESAARAQSLETYLAHRSQTLRADIAELRDFLFSHDPLPDVVPHLQRLLPFAPNIDATDPAPSLCFNLKHAFGLHSADDSDGSSSSCCIPLRKLGRAMSLGGTIDFARFFHDPTLPLKVEVCSGTGEWAVTQAVADRSLANWVAMELRYDRTFEALTRAVTHRARNLCLVAGDAVPVFDHHFIPGTVSSIFVMHPEPPLQLGASAAAQSVAPHLLEAGFLASMARALRPGGTLLVVTDLRWYGEVLLSVCAEVCNRDPSLTPFQPTASYSVPCRKATAAGGVVCLFRGQPGVDCGITAPNASSYFRRLKDQEKAAWNAPDESLRYFLGIRKSLQ